MSLVERLVRGYFATRPDLDNLQKRVNDQMAAYEEREEKRRCELLHRTQQPDEDGFLTVASGRQEPILEQAEQDLPFTGLANFYRFQTRQSKENHLDDLRRKFEEDKQRMAALRKSSLFTDLQ